MFSTRSRHFVLSILGLCLAALGLLHSLLWENIFHKLLENQMVLRPNSKVFDLWQAPPLELNVDIYFFNWTNANDFDNAAVKPKFNEVGPYRFQESNKKVDVVWHPHNASVTYRRQSMYVFDTDFNNGTLQDEIVTFNSLAMATAVKSKYWSPMRQAIADMGISMYQHQVHIRKTVAELLFDGYEDVLLDVANVLPSAISKVNLPFDRIGYSYGRNNSKTYSGVFNMHTGADEIRRIGQLHTWNEVTKTRFFSSECAHVRGSGGEFQTPHLQKHLPIEYFITDLCRPLALEYVDEVFVEGIKGYKYVGGALSVDNGTMNAANKCFCNGECVPSGTWNVSECWFGAPAFGSYPHFYNADPYYLQGVEGLCPQQDKHEFYVILEPTTGLILELNGKIQANLFVTPLPHSSMFSDAREVFMPLFWVDLKTRLTAEWADILNVIPKYILMGKLVGGVFAVIGLVLFSWHPIKRLISGSFQKPMEVQGLDQNGENEATERTASATSPLLDMILPKTICVADDKTTASTNTCHVCLNSG